MGLLTVVRGYSQPVTFNTLAGQPGGGANDGTGISAQFNKPCGVAVDSAGNVYVADTDNHTMRKITPTGTVTTLAGLAGVSGSVDAAGGNARFNQPGGVAVDITGNVYVADSGNHTIRKITPAGVVSTWAGTAGVSGSADLTGTNAQFFLPQGVAVDDATNLYVADYGNHTIRKIAPDQSVTTFAGLAGNSGSLDASGTSARFYQPEGVAVDPAGYVYVADTANGTIRKITPAGAVSTLAGFAGSYGNADGTGTNAQFYQPEAVTVADWSPRLREQPGNPAAPMARTAARVFGGRKVLPWATADRCLLPMRGTARFARSRLLAALQQSQPSPVLLPRTARTETGTMPVFIRLAAWLCRATAPSTWLTLRTIQSAN
jgi:sugar lactone lactonase YvrE